jgi:large subunit ribosomal protein L14
MIQMRSILDVADNSARAQDRRHNPIGDRWVATHGLAKRKSPHREAKRRRVERKKCQVVKAVIADEKEQCRCTHTRFDRNAAVLINDQNEPDWHAVFGPVARAARERCS